MEIADEIGFLKPTKSQGMKGFNIGSLDDFLLEENMTIEDILTPAEKQFAIKFALENIKASSEDRFIPGSTSTHLYHGQSIICASINDELIVDFYSLHNKEFVKRLGHEWWNVRNVWKSQPIEKIRLYFGDVIGMYFGFVGELKLKLRRDINSVKFNLLIISIVQASTLKLSYFQLYSASFNFSLVEFKPTCSLAVSM